MQGQDTPYSLLSHTPSAKLASKINSRQPFQLRTPTTITPDLQPLSKNRKYLIGVSGGRDSVALLHLLHASGFKKLVVCHLDHRLRGRQSTADAAFVKKLATNLDLPIRGISKTDVRALAETQNLSLETAARQARHQFFAGLSQQHRCNRVLLAHHADDAAETTLLNLFRGSSRLTQLKSPSEITIGRRTLTLLRPLLSTSREEIDTYIETHKLKFREDASNQSQDHLRNRIRHQLVPLLNEIFDRDITAPLNRAAHIATEEDSYLDSLLQNLDLTVKDRPDALSTTRLAALPIVLQRRAIHTWLKQNAVPKITFEKVEECRSLLDATSRPRQDQPPRQPPRPPQKQSPLHRIAAKER